MPLVRALWHLFQSEIKQIYRQASEILLPILFFLMALTLFPLGLDPAPHFLQQIAPGVMWIITLLAVLSGIERLFRHDVQDGTLEQMLLSAHPLSLLVSAKLLAHWLMLIVPFILMTPFCALLMSLPFKAWFALMGSLFLGTPTLLLLGSIARALTLPLRQGSVLLLLLVLPFYMPVLIFASSAVDAVSHGLSASGEFAWLGVLLLLSLVLAPLATAAALRAV